MTSSDSPDPKTVSRPRWPWLLAMSVLAFLVVGSIWLLIQSATGPMVEDTLRAYAQRYGVEGLRLKVRQTTPWETDIQSIQITGPVENKKNLLEMDSLAIDYSPWGLKDRIIDGITMSGLVLRIEKSPAGWRLVGLPTRRPESTEKPVRKAETPTRPDWQVKRLAIRNSRLELVHDQREFTLPFEFKAFPMDESGDRYRAQLICRPWDQSLKVDLVLDWATQHLIVTQAVADLEAQIINRLVAEETTAPLQGRLVVESNARLALSPLAVETAEVQLRLPQAVTDGRHLILRALNPEEPLATAKLAADRSWALHTPGFTLTTSDHLRILDWHGRLQPADEGWQLAGAFILDMQPTAGDFPHTAIPVTYKGQWQAGGQWHLHLKGQSARWEADGPLGPPAAVENVRANFTPQLDMAVSGHGDQVKFEGTAQLTDLEGLWGPNTLRISALSLQTTGEGPWHQLQGRFDVKADRLRVRAKTFDGHLPRLSVAGDFGMNADGVQLSGLTRISRGTFKMPHQKMRLEGIRLDLPFTWPYAPSTPGGQVRLAALNWNDLEVGAVNGRIRQQARGASFNMTHQSALLPGGKLQVDGRVGLDAQDARARMTLAYRFDRAISAADIDLGALNPDWTGIHVNGRIAAEGRGRYAGGRILADLKLNFSGGRLVMPEKKVGMVGLGGTATFPDLLALRSAPRQPFSFERAYIGDIAATEGRINYQIEPGGVFFLEEGRLKWCRGTVYLPATRLDPEKQDYNVTLWCDRLKLAPLLEQLGAAQADGGGTVSGRIPLRIRAGQFLVDNGFLYSSPGAGGTIRLRGTDMLTAGIPPGTPQYNQLELARQALKEYDYDWVKLSLATAPQEDLLRLKLQLNGRPTTPLPFIYDTQAGGFVPVGPESPGSRFEEIKLDVNFSLPLNRLLEYKDLLKRFS